MQSASSAAGWIQKKPRVPGGRYTSTGIGNGVAFCVATAASARPAIIAGISQRGLRSERTSSTPATAMIVQL